MLGFGSTESCTSRRCLANMLISKDVLTQPQSINCTQVLKLPSILYTTQFIVSILLNVPFTMVILLYANMFYMHKIGLMVISSTEH